MDLFSKIVLKEEIPAAPSKRKLGNNSVDYWPLVILLERAAYLRKMAALGDGSASETLKEHSLYSTILWFRSRSGDSELHEGFASIFHVLDGRATLVTGDVIAPAAATASGEIHGRSIADGTTSQELRVGDVVHIPVGQ